MQTNNNNNWGWGIWPQQQPQQQLPRYEIIEVNGEESARKIRMAPNSKTFLLEKYAPVVWIAETDGVGELTLRDYDLVPRNKKPQIDLSELAERVNKLEELYVQQSNSKSGKKQHNSASNDSTN